MKAIILISLLVSMHTHADGTMKPLQHIQDELLANFTYIAQPGEDIQQFPSGDEPFTGDCDDYYSAAFNQLWQFNYDPFTLILSDKNDASSGHIVACVKVGLHTRCLDNQRMNVSSIRDVTKHYTIDQRLYTK